jgi:hypothetical protein
MKSERPGRSVNRRRLGFFKDFTGIDADRLCDQISDNHVIDHDEMILGGAAIARRR